MISGRAIAACWALAGLKVEADSLSVSDRAGHNATNVSISTIRSAPAEKRCSRYLHSVDWRDSGIAESKNSSGRLQVFQGHCLKGAPALFRWRSNLTITSAVADKKHCCPDQVGADDYGRYLDCKRNWTLNHDHRQDRQTDVEQSHQQPRGR